MAIRTTFKSDLPVYTQRSKPHPTRTTEGLRVNTMPKLVVYTPHAVELMGLVYADVYHVRYTFSSLEKIKTLREFVEYMLVGLRLMKPKSFEFSKKAEMHILDSLLESPHQTTGLLEELNRRNVEVLYDQSAMKLIDLMGS